MKSALDSKSIEQFSARLKAKPSAASTAHSTPEKRQPIHTVYGGAHLFRADTAQRLGATALRTMQEYAPNAAALTEAAGLSSQLSQLVYDRVVEKLRREPVEDFRLDFEDGYGNRPNSEEDGHAESAATELAGGLAAGQLPPYTGIRIKPLSHELHAR